MTRSISTGFDSVLQGDVVRPIILVEMLFDSGAVRLWNGLTDLVYDSDTYTGAGTLLSVSTVEDTADISARGITISLSGISASIMSLALDEKYQNRTANVYFGIIGVPDLLKTESGDYFVDFDLINFDVSDSDRNEYVPIFTGLMDQMTIADSGDTLNIGLTVESRMIDLERPRIWRYTSEDQKRVYPNDKGFDYVNDLQTKTILWGRK